MGLYPKSPHLFILYWSYDAPKKIILIVKRFIQMINNQISFTTNVKLLFTPLFGDYTIVGRLIGFTVRIIEIVVGIAIMAVLVVFLVVLPLVWYALPILLILKLKFFGILAIIGYYFYWSWVTLNIPPKKVKNCSDEDLIEAVRPKSRLYYKTLLQDPNVGMEKLSKEPNIQYLLVRLELDVPTFLDELKNYEVERKSILKYAAEFSVDCKVRYIENESLFVGLVKSVKNYENFLDKFNLELPLIEKGTKWILTNREQAESIYIWQDGYDSMVLGGTGHGMTGRVTPRLDAISEDFTKQALYRGYERYAVRKKSINGLADLLSSSNENILILGQPGSGKTSVVKGMAYEIMRGTAHKSLQNKRIVSIELSGILSGTRTVGDIAEKLKNAIWEAKLSRDVIIFIDEIHTLATTSDSANPEMAAMFSLLEPELMSNQIQFIGATSMKDYRRYIEPNGSFARLFHIYEIDNATKDETFDIMFFYIPTLERNKKILFTYPALNKTIDLSQKLIHERVLPDKALMILDRAAKNEGSQLKVITTKDIANTISEITHVPTEALTQDEAKKVLNLGDEMKKMVIGQDHAIKQISSALMRARAGIRNQNKPIASFLFVGTTGVGKTQTAKALAKTYFGDTKAMIRLDMSEYQQLDSISRLLGSPDGKSKGILTEMVRTKPFALVLLDEIEKAHSNILLTFLQVLDDGRLTDPTGMTIDFTNSIIIATSNAGTREIQDVFNRNGTFEEMHDNAMVQVRKSFAPEFLNRFSGIIVFNPLSEADIKEITKINLVAVKASAKDKGIEINFTDELVELLMKRGYNKEWGARPLARVIEDKVETYLAHKILSQEFKKGDIVTLGAEVLDID